MPNQGNMFICKYHSEGKLRCNWREKKSFQNRSHHIFALHYQLFVYNKECYDFRFVFTNSGALKLEKDVQFQVNDLDLTPYLSGPLQSDSRPLFNMYVNVYNYLQTWAA